MDSKELFPLSFEQAKSLDLKNTLRQYARYWYLFLLGAIIGLAVAVCYLRYYAVSQYVVSGTMLLKDDKSGQSLSNADALNDLTTFKSTRSIDNEIEVLKSKGLMERVVKELGLFTNYYVEERITDREIYGSQVPIRILRNESDSTMAGQFFIVSPKSTDSFNLRDYTGVVTSYHFGQQIRKPYGSFTIVAATAKSTLSNNIVVRFQDIHQVANHYSGSIAIQPVGKTPNVLSISLVDPIPARAKNIVNKLMQVYNIEAIEDKKQSSISTLKFLDERLQLITTELSDVEKGVAKYKSSNSLTDLAAQATNYASQATEYNSQLAEWATQIEVLESIEKYLQDTKDKYTIVPSTLGIKNETLIALIGKYNEVQLERARLLRTMQPTSFLVQNSNEQLANLRVNILENLRNIKESLKITSSNLKLSSKLFQSKVQRIPAMERELQEINRSQAIKQNIYVYLLQKREETALSLAATASAARVLDFAKGGDYPISPNKQIIYLMALLLGLGVPFGAVYLTGLLNSKVRTQQDVVNAVSVPILGEIAHNDTKKTIVVDRRKRTPIAEMFQLVRTNLHFAAPDKQSVVLLVTSGMSGEGKTFFSINISASLIATGRKVVLLDLDMRMPKVAAQLGLTEQLGITDYLTNSETQLTDILNLSEQVPGLYVVSVGPIPENPVELMMSAKFTHLIQELRSEFDYIVLDSSPVGLVADAFTLSPLVDLTVYMVRYNYTRKEQLAIVNNSYKNKTLTQPMLVLNDAKAENGNSYGYGYGYGYGVDEQINKRKKPVF